MLVAKNQLNKEAHSSINARYFLTPKNYKLDIYLYNYNFSWGTIKLFTKIPNYRQ